MHGRILIVDDVATNRIIYKVKLADAFYEPLLAADGQSCLDIARTEKPDLILLDLVLPDMPGPRCCGSCGQTLQRGRSRWWC